MRFCFLPQLEQRCPHVGQCLVLTPMRDTQEEKKFQKSLETIHTRFGRAMKRSAE